VLSILTEANSAAAAAALVAASVHTVDLTLEALAKLLPADLLISVVVPCVRLDQMSAALVVQAGRAAAEVVLFLGTVTLDTAMELAQPTAAAGEQQVAQAEVIDQAEQAAQLYQALLLHSQIVELYTVAHNDLQRFL
jgi:hypothetical protein